jgi:hypothetical protein
MSAAGDDITAAPNGRAGDPYPSNRWRTFCSLTSVSRTFRRVLGALMIVTTVAVTGCSRQDTRIRQLAEDFESLRSTTAGIGDAWLRGDVSGTYAATALDQTFRMLDRQRTELTASPRSLVDPRGAHLSQAGERLARLVAGLTEDVHRGDAEAARRHLGEVSRLTPERD